MASPGPINDANLDDWLGTIVTIAAVAPLYDDVSNDGGERRERVLLHSMDERGNRFRLNYNVMGYSICWCKICNRAFCFHCENIFHFQR